MSMKSTGAGEIICWKPVGRRKWQTCICTCSAVSIAKTLSVVNYSHVLLNARHMEHVQKEKIIHPCIETLNTSLITPHLLSYHHISSSQ